jgi:hypothetical protein
MIDTVEEAYSAADAVGGIGLQNGAVTDGISNNDAKCVSDAKHAMSTASEAARKPCTSFENWCRAGKAIQPSIAVSKSFKTLRDMVGPDACLDPSCITKIKQLGEGGFATVELSW